ncbi:hypothetical protein B0H63DRAFT_448917 [Podospora didyma]|uniref:Uncharacterized protein n=1 Tax=Podospora didyma TaxID=330526 RepID=A0AAE0NNI3_9PEZI|nr:hypothetical protein B0H63DRAFT_448917 [Podospora didyma]
MDNQYRTSVEHARLHAIVWKRVQRQNVMDDPDVITSDLDDLTDTILKNIFDAEDEVLLLFLEYGVHPSSVSSAIFFWMVDMVLWNHWFLRSPPHQPYPWQEMMPVACIPEESSICQQYFEIWEDFHNGEWMFDIPMF